MTERATRRFTMLRSFHVADVLTLANAASGTGAIFFAMAYVSEGNASKVYGAGVVLVLAVVFDVLDGRVARWRHRASAMGRELDSLADAVSFGVAPACIAYAVGLDGAWDTAALIYFVACGISRLARYNITSEELADETGKVAYFEGTPIPTSLVLVLLLVALTAFGRVGADLPGGAWSLLGGDLHPLALLYVLSGSLMISKTVRIPKP